MPKPSLPRPDYTDVALQIQFWADRLERRGAYKAVADDIRDWLQRYDFTATHDYRIAVEMLQCWKFLSYIDDIGLYFLHHGQLRKKLIQIKGPEEIMTREALDHVHGALRATIKNIKLTTF